MVVFFSIMGSTSVGELEEEVTDQLCKLVQERDSVAQAQMAVEEVLSTGVNDEQPVRSYSGYGGGIRGVVSKKSSKRHLPKPSTRASVRRRTANNAGREELQRLAAIPTTTYCELLRATGNVLPSWASGSTSDEGP